MPTTTTKKPTTPTYKLVINEGGIQGRYTDMIVVVVQTKLSNDLLSCERSDKMTDLVENLDLIGARSCNIIP